MGAGVEPGEAARHLLDVQLSKLHVAAVDVGYLQLAARRWLQRRREIENAVVVDVETGHRVARSRLAGLLLDADGSAGTVELDHTVALGILDMIAEDRPAGGTSAGATQERAQARAEEDVVAEDERRRTVAHEVATERKGLGQALRLGLDDIGD